MKAFCIAAAALVLAGCATQPQPKPQPAAAKDADLATRISTICALPESERDKQIEQMKKETGMVLYCGRR